MGTSNENTTGTTTFSPHQLHMRQPKARPRRAIGESRLGCRLTIDNETTRLQLNWNNWTGTRNNWACSVITCGFSCDNTPSYANETTYETRDCWINTRRELRQQELWHLWTWTHILEPREDVGKYEQSYATTEHLPRPIDTITNMTWTTTASSPDDQSYST